jgi:site-specific recombinase XerD
MSKPRQPALQQILEARIAELALMLRPSSVDGYRTSVRSLLRYLALHYPRMHSPSALRRDPHLLGWVRHLAGQDPPLSKGTRWLYLLCVRRLLEDCSAQYPGREGLILGTDFPRLDHYLPKPLSPEDDRLLQKHLRARDDLASNALLLLRYSGMRIGELLHLPADCLRHLDGQQWALHVPMGKLHTDRWVPIDDQVRELHARLLLLRQQRATAADPNLLLPQPHGHRTACKALRRVLRNAAQQAGCSRRVTPHQLRHTYATEMLRAGASLPALMHLLGHKTITMTLRYLQVTQSDLQREYHRARQTMGTLHAIPELPAMRARPQASEGILAVFKSLLAIRHLLEMYRRRLSDEKPRRKIARLENRLLKISAELDQLINTQK